MKDVDRREFFKKCYKIGGYAAITGLGMGAVKDAMGWGILPSVVGSGGGVVSWANWDESSEATLASEDTYVALFEGGLGSNEIGQGGGLSESDRTLTQVGDIAAASGSPPKRLIDRPNGDYFTAPAVTLKAFFNGTGFTYIAKCNAMSAIGGIVEIYDGTRHLFLDTSGRFLTGSYTTNDDVTWGVGPGLPTGDIYFYFFDDGSNTYWAWSVNKCTKLSEIPTNNRVNRASINGTQVDIIRAGVFSTDYSSPTLVISGYYVIFSHLCLIDTAA